MAFYNSSVARWLLLCFTGGQSLCAPCGAVVWWQHPNWVLGSYFGPVASCSWLCDIPALTHSHVGLCSDLKEWKWFSVVAVCIYLDFASPLLLGVKCQELCGQQPSLVSVASTTAQCWCKGKKEIMPILKQWMSTALDCRGFHSCCWLHMQHAGRYLGDPSVAWRYRSMLTNYLMNS